MDTSALFKISYGLFVLSVRDGEKDNGCIVNTVTQVTSQPQRITVCVSKQNLTHDLLQKTGKCAISVLSQDAPFSLFQRFGFQSGRDAEKWADVTYAKRDANGILYLTAYTNAYYSAKVLTVTDLGTHSLDVSGAVAVKTGELDAVVTHVFDRLKRCAQICYGIVTYGINLYSNR